MAGTGAWTTKNRTDPTEAALELLIIDRSLNAAEAKISALKNAHLAVHATSVASETALFVDLDEKRHDIIICYANHDSLDLTETLAICRKARPDAPIIVI